MIASSRVSSKIFTTKECLAKIKYFTFKERLNKACTLLLQINVKKIILLTALFTHFQ